MVKSSWGLSQAVYPSSKAKDNSHGTPPNHCVFQTFKCIQVYPQESFSKEQVPCLNPAIRLPAVSDTDKIAKSTSRLQMPQAEMVMHPPWQKHLELHRESSLEVTVPSGLLR